MHFVHFFLVFVVYIFLKMGFHWLRIFLLFSFNINCCLKTNVNCAYYSIVWLYNNLSISVNGGIYLHVSWTFTCFQSYSIISKVVFKTLMANYLSLYGEFWWKENDAYGFKSKFYCILKFELQNSKRKACMFWNKGEKDLLKKRWLMS